MSEQHDELDGFTIRDIVIETRNDVKEIKNQIPHFVTWPKLGAAAATIAGIVIGIIKL